VDDHTRALVQHGKVFVLVEDLERQLFADDVRWRGRRDVHRHGVALAHCEIGFRGPANDNHTSVGDQPLDLGSRMFGQHRDEKAIEPLAVEVRRNGELYRCHEIQASNPNLICAPAPQAAGAGAGVRKLESGVYMKRYAATLRLRFICCGVSGRVRDSQMSMARLSGASTTEMSCDVDIPNISPRGSPR
jgi:hypothetical protein